MRSILTRVKFLRRLDRYLITETLGPLALGFLVYTFVVLAQFLLSRRR